MEDDHKIDALIEQIKDLNKTATSIFALLAFQIVVACLGIAFVILTIKGFKI